MTDEPIRTSNSNCQLEVAKKVLISSLFGKKKHKTQNQAVVLIRGFVVLPEA